MLNKQCFFLPWSHIHIASKPWPDCSGLRCLILGMIICKRKLESMKWLNGLTISQEHTLVTNFHSKMPYWYFNYKVNEWYNRSDLLQQVITLMWRFKLLYENVTFEFAENLVGSLWGVLMRRVWNGGRLTGLEGACIYLRYSLLICTCHISETNLMYILVTLKWNIFL